MTSGLIPRDVIFFALLTRINLIAMRTFYYTIFLLILLFISTFSYGQKLKGKVKSYHDTYFTVQEYFGKIKKDIKLQDPLFPDQYVAFDQNGKVTEAIEYNSDGSVFCTFKGRNNTPNNAAESIFVRFEPEITIAMKPFIIESAKYSWGEMCVLTYVNDSSGLPAEEIIYDLMGAEIYKILIKRDEKGNPLEYNFSDGTSYKFRWDNKGNKIECFYRSPFGKTIITSSKFDSSGNVIEENINDSHLAYYHFHYEHNTFVYKTDKYGNWIQKIEYEHDLPMRMVVRTIEYSN